MFKLFAFSMALILLAAACLAADKPATDDEIWDQVSIKLTGDPIAKGGVFKVEVQAGRGDPHRSSRVGEAERSGRQAGEEGERRQAGGQQHHRHEKRQMNGAKGGK